MQRSRSLRPAVVPRVVLGDRTDLKDRGLELVEADPVVDRVEISQDVIDAAPCVSAEVGAYAGPEIRCLADVDRGPGLVPERVYARSPWQVLGEGELSDSTCAFDRRKREEIVEMGNPN